MNPASMLILIRVTFSKSKSPIGDDRSQTNADIRPAGAGCRIDVLDALNLRKRHSEPRPMLIDSLQVARGRWRHILDLTIGQRWQPAQQIAQVLKRIEPPPAAVRGPQRF